MNKFSLFFILLLISIPITLGAKILGNVYDSDLTKLENVVVDISTSPRQVFVARTGEYQFNVTKGDYIIRARQKNNELFTLEKLSVKDEGDYVLDLILLPNIGEEVFLINETYVEEPVESNRFWYFILLFIAIFLAVAAIYFYSKAKKLKHFVVKQVVSEVKVPLLDEDSRKIMNLLKNQGGRATQKELRKNFPASEAKISLIITDLESRKLVKKIKKGRGNIVILVE